jgi:hypothetical protein
VGLLYFYIHFSILHHLQVSQLMWNLPLQKCAIHLREVRPHVTRKQLIWYSWNLMSASFSNICRHILKAKFYRGRHICYALRTLPKLFIIQTLWSSESSGMYCHVLNWMLTDVLEVRAAFITHRPDDGGSTHLWNVGRHSITNTAVHSRRFWASYSPPWELEISHTNLVLRLTFCCKSDQQLFETV